MPRIPYAGKGTEAKGATVTYTQLEEEFGFVPNLLKVLGHSGPATQAMGAVLDNLFHHVSLNTAHPRNGLSDRGQVQPMRL